MHHAPLDLVTLKARPDLLAIVQSWLGERRALPAGPEHCFVLLAGGVPAGTASLAESSLATRPDLGPWLANLFVPERFRGRGYAGQLVGTVEGAAQAARVPTLWLVTRSAERLYARLGWQAVGPALFQGDPATLMRRDLAPVQKSRTYQKSKACQKSKAYRAESAAT